MPMSSPARSSSHASPSRRLAASLASLALLFGLTSVAVAGPTATAGTPETAGADVPESPTGLYIVQLNDPPLALYSGGIQGLAATAPSVTGETKLDMDSAASRAYREYLTARQDSVLAALGVDPEASPERYRLHASLNGFIGKLSHEQAIVASRLPEVRAVEADGFMDFTTDVGPEWIDAPTIWGFEDGEALRDGGAEGCETAVNSCGEGIVVGIIDTGINTSHPSFADEGGDGYDHTNPRGAGVYYGECEDDPTLCNDKLIGAYDMTEECVLSGNCDPEDDNGHGSHTASTAAGNVLDAALVSPTLALSPTISGVAPHANIIS